MKNAKVIAVIVILIAVAATVVVHFGKSSDLVSDPSKCVHSTLAVNASGHCVSDAQNMLNWSLYGIDGPNYQKVTGQFDATMTTEVSKFQTNDSIPQTGTITLQTWQKLCSDASDAPATWTTAATDAGCKL